MTDPCAHEWGGDVPTILRRYVTPRETYQPMETP